MAENANIDLELMEQLSESLAALPEATINGICHEQMADTRLRPDAFLKAQIAGRAVTFVIETRGDVYPRDAREITWQLDRYRRETGRDGQDLIPMILARSVSEGAREFLREERVAYHDQSGSLFISDGDLYLLIDRPKPKSSKRREFNVFKGTRARVLFVLFDHVGDWVTGSEIAEHANVSPATVSETFKNLERRDWLEVKGEGPSKRRRLARPDALLDAWRNSILASRPTKRKRYFVPRMSPEDMAAQIEGENYYDDYELELTGQFAAQQYTPFLSSISDLTVRTFGRRNHEWLVSMLNAREVSEGANLAVLDAPSKKVRHPRNYGEKSLLASPLQVYLDLLDGHGRSKEMAEHLRSQHLEWR